MFLLENLLIPPIMFFCLGFLACLFKSDLEFSSYLTDTLSIYLIVALGLHGGITLREAVLLLALKSILVALFLSLAQTLISYFALLHIVRFDKLNAAAIAAHYGSVSLGTFLATVSFLTDQNITFESYPTIMLVAMEVPPILIGLALAKIARKNSREPRSQLMQSLPSKEKSVVREVFTNGGIILLIGSIIIGSFAHMSGLELIKPFFKHIFSGVLCLFLIGMGIEAAKHINEAYKMGVFLILFGIITPIVGALLGIVLGYYVLGFSLGGTTLVAVLGASASYIAVPPVIRMAIPEAKSTFYLTLSLGITFPFNVTIGIPLYFKLAALCCAQ